MQISKQKSLDKVNGKKNLKKSKTTPKNAGKENESEATMKDDDEPN